MSKTNYVACLRAKLKKRSFNRDSFFAQCSNTQISKKVYEKVEFSLAIFTKRIPCLFKEYLNR